MQTPDRPNGNADSHTPTRPFSSTGTRVVLGWTALAAGLMVFSAVSHGIAPRGSRAYGQNLEGELTRNLVMLAVETMVLLLMLQPWSFPNSWARPLLALGLVTPYALLVFAATMHSGPISTVHAFWLIGLVLVLPIVVVHAVARRFRRRT